MANSVDQDETARKCFSVLSFHAVQSLSSALRREGGGAVFREFGLSWVYLYLFFRVLFQ